MGPLSKRSGGPFLFIPLGSIAGRDSVFASLSRPRRVSTRRLSLTALGRTNDRGGFFRSVPPAVPAIPVFGAAMADSGPASACTPRDGMHILKLQPGASAPAVALPRFPTIAFVCEVRNPGACFLLCSLFYIQYFFRGGAFRSFLGIFITLFWKRLSYT